MARALEYIINYPLKRNIVSKSTINVLEIMPDKDCKDYDDLAGQVENWLGLVSRGFSINDYGCVLCRKWLSQRKISTIIWRRTGIRYGKEIDIRIEAGII